PDSYTFLFPCPFLFPFFFFYCSVHHPDLHSFPTRRSSDLHAKILDFGLAKVASAAKVSSGATDMMATVSADSQSEQLTSPGTALDRKSTRLNSSHVSISYAVFCLKKKKQ